MAFCRDLCEGVIGNIRHCMSTPITRTKLYWFGGITLVIIVFIIILCVSIPGGSGTPPKGSDALKSSTASVGVNFEVAKFHESSVDQFDKSKVSYLNSTLIKLQIFGTEADCGSQYKDAATLTLNQVDYLTRLIPHLGLKLARNKAEISAASQYGGTVGLISVRGGQSLDLRLSMLRVLYGMGVRIVSINSFGCSTPWAKAAGTTVDEKYTLTDYGKAMVEEMNRLGILIDIGGADVETQAAVIDASKAPVAAIDVGLRSIYDHPANLDHNKIVPKLKEKEGLVMLTTDCKLIVKEGTCTKDNFTQLLQQGKSSGLKLALGGLYFPDSKAALDYTQLQEYFDWLYANHYSMQFLKGLAGDNFINALAAVEKYSNENKKTPPKETGFDKSTLVDTNCYTIGHVPTSSPTTPTTPNTVTSPTTATTAVTNPTPTAQTTAKPTS